MNRTPRLWPSRQSRLPALLSLTIVFALSLVLTFPRPVLAQDSRPVLLVADFTNETGDEKWRNVGIGLAGAISVKLNHVKSIRVVTEETRRRVMANSDSGCPVSTGQLILIELEDIFMKVTKGKVQ